MAQEVQVKSILNKTKRRDPWFLDEYRINPEAGIHYIFPATITLFGNENEDSKMLVLRD